MSSDPPADALAAALVAAYRPWVAGRLAERGAEPPPGFEDAVAVGEVWLEDELTRLLETPAARQRRSPLELFQEAMRFPTEALAAAGVPPVARDDAAIRALPGDRYDLAPASSQPLGEEAWRAHLAWGAAKARALAEPAPAAGEVLYVGNNLMDRSAIESAAARCGLRLAAAATTADLTAMLAGRPPLVALVDLTIDGADDAVRAAAAAGAKVIGFGPHVDDWALDRARSLGADRALPRSRFFRTLDDLLPKRA